MMGETENLVVGPLRGMLGDIAAVGKRLDGVDARSDGIDVRLEGIETRLDGWRSVFVATTGSLPTGLEDHDTRIAALEGTPA